MRKKFIQHGDIDFSRDDIHRFLPWLIAVMACLTTLLLSLSISMHGWIEGRHQTYAAHFTVNIPARITEMDTIHDIAALLKSDEQIRSVKRIANKDLQHIMQKWLGSSDVSQLPLPTVLEVTLEDSAVGAFDHDALQQRLVQVIPGIEIDAHENWVKAFASFSNATGLMLLALSLIIISAMAAAVIFAARTALRLHGKTVALLHSIGAEDVYITRQFQRDAMKTSLPGLILGTLAAALIYWAGGSYAASLPASVLPSMAISGSHVALFLLLPVLCCIAAGLVTRIAISGQLGRTL